MPNTEIAAATTGFNAYDEDVGGLMHIINISSALKVAEAAQDKRQEYTIANEERAMQTDGLYPYLLTLAAIGAFMYAAYAILSR